MGKTTLLEDIDGSRNILVKYCRDAKAYGNYYVSQVGHDMRYFAGAQVQQSYGLGNRFNSIAKSVFPLLKKGAKPLESNCCKMVSSLLQINCVVETPNNGHQLSKYSRFESRTSGQTESRQAKDSPEKSTKEETPETLKHFYVNHGNVSTPQFSRIHHFSTSFVFCAPKSNQFGGWKFYRTSSCIYVDLYRSY